jgi:hypothetical protein
MEPLPTIREQIREQSGGAAGAFFKRLLLWVLIFGGATLAWWQIWRLEHTAQALLAGGPWPGGRGATWALALAVLGVVLGVGLSVITILATDLFSAFLATVLLFAPMALFRLWEPLWIWWILGPLAVLILLCFLGLRSDAAGRVRWSPLGLTVGATFWVLLLIWFVAPTVAFIALVGYPDHLRPEAFRPLARRIVQRVPADVVEGVLAELPQGPPPTTEVPTPAAVTPPPVTPAPTPEAPTPAPAPAPLPPPPPAPFTPAPATPPQAAPTAPTSASPTPVLAPFSKKQHPKQAVSSPEPVSETVPVYAVAESAAAAASPEALGADLAGRLAGSLWQITSSQGEGYGSLPPLLPVVASVGLTFFLIPLIILGLIESFVIVGLILWVLRASDFIRCVPVRVEVERYTLRGPRPGAGEADL